MGGTAYTGSRPGYVYTTRHGVTDYYPDAARPSLLTRLASWRGTGPEAVVVTGEVVGAETVPEPEGRQSEQQSRDRLSLENGRRGDVRGGGVARQEMDRGGGGGSMSPDLLNGCWVASVCPIPFIWAIYHNQKVTDDRVRGEQASVGIARPPQRREPFPRRQRLRLLFWLPDPLR